MGKAKEKEDNKEVEKKTIWDRAKSTNGKFIIAFGLFASYQAFLPVIKDVMGFTADNKAIVVECNKYTDEAIEDEKKKGQLVFDVLVNDVYELQQIHALSTTFAVGLRADANGIISYRSRHKALCSVRINHVTNIIEYYSERKQEWLPILFEDY